MSKWERVIRRLDFSKRRRRLRNNMDSGLFQRMSQVCLGSHRMCWACHYPGPLGPVFGVLGIVLCKCHMNTFRKGRGPTSSILVCNLNRVDGADVEANAGCVAFVVSSVVLIAFKSL